MDSKGRISVADELVKLVLAHYQKLGKGGKPQIGECTHLAAFCAVWNSGEKQVLSIATGTKCLGASEVSKDGCSINDSHAEVLARRALVRFLLTEAQDVLTKGKDSKILVKDSLCGRLRFLQDLRLHFFITHPPCGDSAIFPRDHSSSILKDGERPESSDETMEPERATRQKLDEEDAVPDIYRTGAKCTIDGPQDRRLPGVDYHELGAWRTKPGRGERTLSMSCSDKMAKWTVMGVQGALLMHVLAEPLYIDTVIVGGGCPYSEKALHRAIVERNVGFEADGCFGLHAPVLLYWDNAQFRFRPVDRGASSTPSHLSMLWHFGMQKLEVLVDGYKQGMTLAKRHRESARSVTCRWSLARHLMSFNRVNEAKIYYDLKKTGGQYRRVWTCLRNFYRYWNCDERKAEAQQFSLCGDST